MVLTVQRDVYNAQTDSLADNLCDVFIDASNNSAPQPTGSCFITGKDTIRIGGSRKYTATFTDSRGERVITPTEWAVTVPEGITYEKTADEVRISVPLDEKYVGETITILAYEAEGRYGTYEKKVQVITVG